MHNFMSGRKLTEELVPVNSCDFKKERDVGVFGSLIFWHHPISTPTMDLARALDQTARKPSTNEQEK